MESPTCPKCKHPVSEHYAECCMVYEDNDIGTGDYCRCDEQFNLATGKRLPNRSELIALLNRAAETLQEMEDSDMNNWLAMEIWEKLKGE